MDAHRAALFAYKLRLSPETQPIRQSVIDEVTLRKLELCCGPDGATIGKVTTFTAQGWPWPTLAMAEVRESLHRLDAAGLVGSSVSRKKAHWTLLQAGKDHLDRERIIADDTVDRALRALFGDVALKDIFLTTLARLFDRLAKSYVEATFDRAGPTTLPFIASALEDAVATVAAEHPEVDSRAFADGLKRFFRDQSPDFEWLKWGYCQTYYLLRMLGTDATAGLLSGQIFAGSQIYLDTNVIIELLDPGSPQRASLQAVMAGLRAAGTRLCVLRITLQELDRVFARELPGLEATLRQIPTETISKVRGALARAEAIHRQDPTQPSPQELAELFAHAEQRLQTDLAVEILDDPWFTTAAPSNEILERADALRRHYDRRLGRRKRPDAAIHDALALTWIGRQSGSGCGMVCLLTLDLSLPTFRDTSGAWTQRAAVSLDALLPWLGAVVDPEATGLPAAYSTVLGTQLFGMATRFTLQDFRLLAEIGMECAKLPAEDVESCLVYLRREAPGTDASTAAGRERIHHLVKRFFASPDLRYLKELTTLRGQIEDDARRLLALSDERTALAKTLDEEREARKAEVERSRDNDAKHRVIYRIIISGGLLVALEAGALLLAINYGEGTNHWLRVGSLTWLFAIPPLVIAPCFRVLCGKRLWPTAKRLLWFWRN